MAHRHPWLGRTALAALLLALAAAPAAAQFRERGPAKPAPDAPAPEQAPEQALKPAPDESGEVVIIAPRRAEPDFQTVDEYHKAEFARLDAIYGKPPPPEPRGDGTFETGGAMESPNTRSSTVDTIRTAPPLRETLGGQ